MEARGASDVAHQCREGAGEGGEGMGAKEQEQGCNLPVVRPSLSGGWMVQLEQELVSAVNSHIALLGVRNNSRLLHEEVVAETRRKYMRFLQMAQHLEREKWCSLICLFQLNLLDYLIIKLTTIFQSYDYLTAKF